MTLLASALVHSHIEVSQLVEGFWAQVFGVGLDLGEAGRLGERVLLF